MHCQNDLLFVPLGSPLHEVEKHLILRTLTHFEWNKRQAADALGVSLKTLYNKLHVYERAA